MEVNNRNRSKRPVPEVLEHMKRHKLEHEAGIQRREEQKVEAGPPVDPEKEEGQP